MGHILMTHHLDLIVFIWHHLKEHFSFIFHSTKCNYRNGWLILCLCVWHMFKFLRYLCSQFNYEFYAINGCRWLSFLYCLPKRWIILIGCDWISEIDKMVYAYASLYRTHTHMILIQFVPQEICLTAELPSTFLKKNLCGAKALPPCMRFRRMSIAFNVR